MDSDPMSTKPQLTADSVLSPQELRALNTELKSIVWVLRVYCPNNNNQIVESFSTAFSIDRNGLIMTSAHTFVKRPYIITARRLHDVSFLHKVEEVHIKHTWDIAVLRVKNVSDCNFGRLAVDRSLFVGQKLLHIGHPGNLVGSLFVGTVAFPCMDDVDVPQDNQICSNYICTALDITPRYRIMGHIWNVDAWIKAKQNEYEFERQLHPQTPIIQIYGLGSREGCSGGPVFNIKGEIVGIMSMGFLGFEIAIHSSLLRQVLSETEEKMQGGNNKQGGNQAGCSKRHKK
ncbi:uncharacterized protein LOC126687159 [Mercurialis annua]|uniref:uncharacterized protein LOC126687159 n=1 Tax=Mercurialis annua TaxID=3986 RepID=UPI00215E70A8|nr:uncharacterized protein LOC126687159 [Mercurialis annua]